MANFEEKDEMIKPFQPQLDPSGKPGPLEYDRLEEDPYPTTPKSPGQDDPAPQQPIQPIDPPHSPVDPPIADPTTVPPPIPAGDPKPFSPSDRND